MPRLFTVDPARGMKWRRTASFLPPEVLGMAARRTCRCRETECVSGYREWTSSASGGPARWPYARPTSSFPVPTERRAPRSRLSRRSTTTAFGVRSHAVALREALAKLDVASEGRSRGTRSVPLPLLDGGPRDDPILLLPREPDWAGPRHPPRARRAQVNVGGTSTDPRFSSVEASLVTDATALGRDRIKPNSVWAAA